jgi:signal peptidase I
MRRSLRVASLLAVVAAAAIAWIYLAPLQLGGGTSYAVVYGSSMEPHLHRGDLVILRRQPSYRLGEVVGYRSRELHRNVLHRIVAVNGGRFAFKGDNNGFRDPEQPAAGQLFGAQWVAIPQVGGWLERLRSPRDAAIVAGLAMLLLVGGGSGAGVRRRKRPPVPRAARAPASPVAAAPAVASPSAHGHEPAAIAAVVLGVLGLSVVALGATVGLLAARQPAERTIAEPGLYVQHGAFAVSAPAPVGAVYQLPSLDASDPIFLKLVHKLDVRFGYRLRSPAPVSVTGTAKLDAVLSDGNGWQRRFALAPSRRFRGSHVTLVGTLWLPSLLNAIRQFETGTGEHYTAYHLELGPHVRLRGVVGGRLVRETFAPKLSYDLDALRLQLAHPPASAGSNALVRSRATAGSRLAASTLHLFGRRLGVASARRLALVTLGAGLVATLASGAFFLRRRRDDELAAIERRYGDLIVAVAAGVRPQAPERRVATMEALVRIAERYDRLVLHEERDGLHSFLVDDAGLVYRYDVGGPAEATTEIRPANTLRPRPVHIRSVDR